MRIGAATAVLLIVAGVWLAAEAEEEPDPQCTQTTVRGPELVTVGGRSYVVDDAGEPMEVCEEWLDEREQS